MKYRLTHKTQWIARCSGMPVGFGDSAEQAIADSGERMKQAEARGRAAASAKRQAEKLALDLAKLHQRLDNAVAKLSKAACDASDMTTEIERLRALNLKSANKIIGLEFALGEYQKRRPPTDQTVNTPKN